MNKRNKPQALGELLKEALRDAPSIRGVERATGISAANLSRFMNDKSGLRLEAVERLAEHFNIVFERKPRQQD